MISITTKAMLPRNFPVSTQSKLISHSGKSKGNYDVQEQRSAATLQVALSEPGG